MLLLITKFIFFLSLLVYSGEWLVKILSRLAHYWRLSYFLIAFLIMALATSIPEFFISITSALNKTPELALGVIFGTMTASALVLGSDLIFAPRPIKLGNTISRSDSLYTALIVFLPFVFIFNGVISRFEGLVLIMAAVIFSYHLFWTKKRFLRTIRHPYQSFSHKVRLYRFLNIFKQYLFLILAIIVLLFSARLVVEYGKEMALSLPIPLVVIGLSFLAFSTTLPELIFEIKSVRMARSDLALGDLTGTMVVNAGLILGLTALIYPITISDFYPYWVTALYLALFLLFFIFLLKKPLGKWVGIILVLSYLIFLLIEFYG